MEYKHTNQLVHETSPYLLQHAHNPVEWYPWGDEAFTKAGEEDKPILLSIGYSACHWCHVMEEESFENEEIAAVMNQNFINIKVDREERPDIDDVYQYAVQLFGGNGGWPLTIFLTPEGKPFFGGTYFPPQERQGLKGLPEVLLAVAGAYRDRRKEIEATTSEVTSALKRLTDRVSSEKEINPGDIDNAASRLLRHYDPSHGGFGTAPKFPNTTQLSLLLQYYQRTGDPLALQTVRDTLHHMAEGGIYDQLGGGFHRYAIDERWLIPHFEKMLYDNALLSRIYLDTYKITREPFYKEIAEETLMYLLREMYHPDGGFYSSQDADSEGGEGKFFLWSKEEMQSILSEDAEVVCRFYGVTEGGNFEGGNVLHADRGLKALSHEFGLPEEEVRNLLKRGKERLFLSREQRIKPFRDTKIITEWNGLVISALINAYQTTGGDLYLDAARRTLDFVRDRLIKDGVLFHVWKDGTVKVNGDLTDYVFMTAAALDMFEATFDEGYLLWAEGLTKSLTDLFRDSEQNGFYHTAGGTEVLFHRLKTGNDQSLPSGNAVASTNLLRLSAYRDHSGFRTMAEQLVRLFYDDAIESPFNYPSLLSSAYLCAEGMKEITIVGSRDSDELKELLRRLGEMYLPYKVIYLVDDAQKGDSMPSFARDKRRKDNRTTVYICQNFTCSKPLTEWRDIERLLLRTDQAYC